MKKISLEDALILRAVKAARALVRRLPPEAALGLARSIGWVLYVASKRRNIAYRNVRAAFASELPRARMKWIARESMLSLTSSLIELLRAPDLTQEHVYATMRIEGEEKLKKVRSEGRSIIFLAAHFGNWELLSIVACIFGYPIVALTREQKHPRSDDYLTMLRSSHGVQVIRKGMPLREILKALKTGRGLGILGDQDAGKGGIFVRFFGRQSSSAVGPAAFALRTGASICPSFCFREAGGRHRIEIEGPLTVSESLSPQEAEKELLQLFASILESKIRRAPEQWLWAHRRWKSSPDRFVLVLSDRKAGHLNQSLAVAEAIRIERALSGAGPENFHLKIVEIRYKSSPARRFLAAVAFLTGGWIPFKYPFLKAVLEPASFDEAMKCYADVVVSCGSSLVPINLILKKENDCRSVVVMKPFFGMSRFDAVIVPRHDRVKPAKNVFVTGRAPSLVTEESMRKEGAKLALELGLKDGPKRVGVLIGGDTPEVQFGRREFGEALESLSRLSASSGTQILATSSRRTPVWADELLKSSFADRGRCPLLVIANEANRPGVVNAILGASDVIVVSGESMSMVSEAVSSGKPVVVFMPAGDMRLKAKYRSFLDRMAKEKLVVSTAPKDLFEAVSGAGGPRASAAQGASDAEVLRNAVKRVA
jgi:KDO2-lipid IV(A) lauroyltransferase